MLDICLLGTGGTQPLVNRWLTALVVRYSGHALLIDCGEGTQIAAQRAGISLKPVDKILLTHLHADHVSGLPGLLLTMGNMGRTESVSVIGPRGTERLIDAVRVIAPNLPFELRVSELDTEQELMYFLECDIEAFAVQHGVPCYGYSISLPRAGKFDAARARELGIPLPFWSRLQKGESIEHEGQLYTPELVMGPPRRGLKLTYCTDSRPTPAIAAAARDADLFICEGMYGDDESLPKARENRHMLFSEAARLAADAGGVRELWLTHYSPSLPNPKAYRDVARAIFPNSFTARDGWVKELRFEDT
ncbi:MAG TPA: ribonuclease Z [Candidatus Akkermansia intestinavium]|nr:ribonuclease Z [Candidatus Akkermansia intestinavium]